MVRKFLDFVVNTIRLTLNIAPTKIKYNTRTKESCNRHNCRLSTNDGSIGVQDVRVFDYHLFSRTLA